VIIDHVSSFGGDGEVQGDEVGLSDEGFEWNEGDLVLVREAVVRCGVIGEDVESESAGADGGRLTDASETDESECAAPDAGEWVAVPFAAADFLIECGEAAADGHEHGDGVFCDGVVIAAWGGGDDDAAFIAGGEVDGIEADACAGEDFEARAGRDDIRGVGFGAGDDGVVVLDSAGEDGGVPEIEAAVNDDAFMSGISEDLEMGTGFSIQRCAQDAYHGSIPGVQGMAVGLIRVAWVWMGSHFTALDTSCGR
jgi:hypothetical protein